MTTWQIQITCGDTNLLSSLTTYLPPPHAIKEDAGRYYLFSSDFESLTTYTEVDQCINGILSQLNAFIKLLGYNVELTRLYPIIHVDSQGIIHLAVIDPIKITDHSIRTYIGDSYFQYAVNQHPDLLEKVLKNTDPMVVDALHIFSKETNWPNLRKIFEIIDTDVQRLIKSNKFLPNSKLRSSRNRWTVGTQGHGFWESANNARLNKEDSLHPLAKSDPVKHGTVDMSLEEAKAYISDLIITWIEETKL